VDQTASYQYVNATAATSVGPVAADWYTLGFDDSSWFTGNGVFSSGPTSGTIFDTGNASSPYSPGPTDPIPTTYTQWGVNYDPYLRTSFTLTAQTALTIWIAVDNGINSLYLNGVQATAPVNAEGNAFRWESVFDIPAEYTNVGLNVIALQLEDHGGATGFDMMVTYDDTNPNQTFTTNAPVPEPATMTLVALGLGAFGYRRRSNRRANRS
jgi:hypothetical protein